MNSSSWFILLGALMVARGLWGSPMRHWPLSSAIVYLCVGLLLGPALLSVLVIDPLRQSRLLEVLAEVAVLISLFSAGVKMPVPVTLIRWGTSLRLAWLAMALTVGLVALFAVTALHMPWGAGILLGAILAPTDPVLATDVQVRHAGDKEPLRFALTCEAGMNDGSAFPFVMLGLSLLGLHETGGIGGWLLRDVLWGTAAAILIGVAGGTAMGLAGVRLRRREPRHEMLDDLLGLGLGALVYGLCLLAQAWGFLAVFFAGVALRQTELRLIGAPRDRHGLRNAAPHLAHLASSASHPMTVSGETLQFKEHLERLSELALVLLLGGAVSNALWQGHDWWPAVFLLLVARPASVLLSLHGSAAPRRLRAMSAWFGVRGIGSIYYLMFAINQGLPAALAQQLVNITLLTILLSIVLHGATVAPLLERYQR